MPWWEEPEFYNFAQNLATVASGVHCSGIVRSGIWRSVRRLVLPSECGEFGEFGEFETLFGQKSHMTHA
jgi:hypothetical protein